MYPGTIFSVYLLSPVDSGSLFLVVDLVVGTSDKMEAGSKWIVSWDNSWVSVPYVFPTLYFI